MIKTPILIIVTITTVDDDDDVDGDDDDLSRKNSWRQSIRGCACVFLLLLVFVWSFVVFCSFHFDFFLLRNWMELGIVVSCVMSSNHFFHCCCWCRCCCFEAAGVSLAVEMMFTRLWGDSIISQIIVSCLFLLFFFNSFLYVFFFIGVFAAAAVVFYY